MNQTEFCRRMGWRRADLTPLRPIWRACAARCEEVPPFYAESFIRTWAPVMHPNDELLAQMIDAGRFGAATPEGRLFGHLLHRAVYGPLPVLPIGGLPLPVKAFGDRAGLLQLLAALAAFPMIVESFRAAGIPRRYAEACGGWLAGTVEIFRAAHEGVPGHTISQLFWMRHYIELEVFRVGRLEFQPGEYPALLPALFRRRGGNEIVALCRSDRWYTPEGGPAAPGAPGAVRTRLLNADGVIVGTPVDLASGKVLVGRTERLSCAEWENLNEVGDPVMTLHIPGGGGLTPEAVRASLREAVGFFRKYRGIEPKIWWCVSWILNRDWEELIPDTNIVRFGRIGHRCPEPLPNDREGLFFIFGRSDGFPAGYAARTRMEKAFHEAHRRGRKLRCGTMFLLTEEIAALR